MAVKFTKPEINVREKLAELDKPSGIAGEAMLRAETVAEQQALIGVGRRNLLINGGFDVWQRGTSATHSTTSGYGKYIAADRWSVYYTGTKLEAKEYTINNEFKHAMRITSTTGNTVYAYQTIEGGSTLSNQTLTYSYWARANRVAVISGNNTWRYGGVNSDTPVYNVAGPASLNSHHVDTEWRKITHTVTLINDSSGPSFGRHLFFLLSLDDPATNDWLEVAEVQLELGKVATPFEHRSYGEELALCQRYCYVIGHPSQVIYLGTGSMYTTTAVNLSVPLPVQLRHNSPSFTRVPNSTGNWLNVYVGAAGTLSNAAPLQGDYSQSNVRIYIPGAHSGSSPSAVGAGVWSMVLAGAQLIINAEL